MNQEEEKERLTEEINGKEYLSKRKWELLFFGK
jgi:hypothetical protein